MDFVSGSMALNILSIFPLNGASGKANVLTVASYPTCILAISLSFTFANAQTSSISAIEKTGSELSSFIC